MAIYCTYITVYSGNKLPPFYIGSSTIEKINLGYHGSVKSKLYKSIWLKELKDNPLLFKTKIISIHSKRSEALEKELKFHVALNVVKSDMYINMAIANKNGCFGMKYSAFKGKKHSEESKLKNSIAHKNKVPWNKGLLRTEEEKRRMSIGRTRVQLGKTHKKVMCPHCNKIGGFNGMTRYHFNNCKLLII